MDGDHKRTLRELAQELKNGSDAVPESYEVVEQLRPKQRHDDYAKLPVIDLKLVKSDRRAVVDQLGQAAREWGFFQIINHGLSADELREIESQSSSFFRLPAETKLKLAKENEKGQRGYMRDGTKKKSSSLHWAESLMVSYKAGSTFEDELGAVFPEKENGLRKALVKYCDAVDDINKLLLELMAESLNLETNFFSQHFNDKRILSLRLNFYPVCPEPSRTLGAKEHTDASILTILLQDKVGGLQIQRAGVWHGVEPLEGALLVNVGDTLHAWTNGRFQSVMHRVIVNTEAERLSMAAFQNVDFSFTLSAPDQLVDENHPRLFRPFTFTDYMQQVAIVRQEFENGLRPTPDAIAGLRYTE